MRVYFRKTFKISLPLASSNLVITPLFLFSISLFCFLSLSSENSEFPNTSFSSLSFFPFHSSHHTSEPLYLISADVRYFQLFRTRQEQDSKGPCHVDHPHFACKGEQEQRDSACSKIWTIWEARRQTPCLIFASLIKDHYLWMEAGAWRRQLLSLMSCHQVAATVGGREGDFFLSLAVNLFWRLWL